MTVNRLADRLRPDADVVSVARLYAGQDADLFDVLNEIIADEHVPFLAALPVQGRQACCKRTPVGADLGAAARGGPHRRAAGYRQCRRSTPPPTSGRSPTGGTAASSTCPRSGSSPTRARAPDSDGSLLLGWAGWDHREQATALIDPDRGALYRRRLGHANG